MIDFIRRSLGYGLPPLGPQAFQLFQRLGPKSMRSQLFPGIQADLDFHDATQLLTWWQGERFEKPTPDIVKHWLGSGTTTFFDIGSNYGFFSYLVLSSDSEVRVHAFEPHPKTFARLNSIKTHNRLDRLSCWNMGLGDKNEELVLQPGFEDLDLGHTTFGSNPALPQADGSIKVPVRRFTDWRQERGIPIPSSSEWVAKIDVEGFEFRVLNGMREELLARCFKGLVIEINSFTLEFCQTSPEAIYGYLDEVGYRSIQPQEIDPSYKECLNAFFVPKE
jgi:FkbM family methyltransferase